jgi:4'-phosphopantetheinyl transferase
MFLDLANERATAHMGLLTPPSSSCSSAGNGMVTTWLVDTRMIWPGDKIATAVDAAEAMSLISPAEQKMIMGKMFIADARMSLASALLKRLFISQTLDIAWNEVRLARKGDPKHGKPCAVNAAGRPIQGIDFNISHQNGLVALIGWDGRKQHSFNPNGSIDDLTSPSIDSTNGVTVGVDIVCVNERDDYRTIDQEGIEGWVDIYEFVFSEEERWSMKYDIDYVTLLDGSFLTRTEIGRHDRCNARNTDITLRTPGPEGKTVKFNSEQLIEAKLRRFYTYFCYKESFIKLSGEALLAPWIKQLEFFDVRSPKPGSPARCSTHGVWGEEVDDVEVHFHGKEVRDVKMKIQAFEEDFMISTAMQGEVDMLKVPGFTTLDLQTDIMDYAAARLDKP